MKKVLIISLFLLLFSLYGCSKKEKELSILIATDTHLYSKNLLSEDNKTYIKENFSSDGRIQEYDYKLFEGLIKEVNKLKPEYFILTGDLSYNGEKDSLLEVKRLLDTINSDTKVLVIPGNHDCYSLNFFSAINDKGLVLEGVTYEEFKDIFTDYGYQNAYSYDDKSLSYIYELTEDKWILMLDTSLSEHNYEAKKNIVGGFLDEETLLWLENNLVYAKEHNIEVISATHHNLLVHNPLFAGNYTLGNAERCLELFSKYQVKLNFSGHLHIQSIKSRIVNDYEVFDIAGGGLLDYGNRYGIVNIYDNHYEYESKVVETEIKNLKKHSFNTFYQEYYDKSMRANSIYYRDDAEKVTDLLSKINAYYFDGNYEKIHSLLFWNQDLENIIIGDTRDYEDSYVRTIIEVENKNQYNVKIKK